MMPFLVALAALVWPVFATAQTGCVPNTLNYPCVYVANGGGDTVSVINATTNSVIAKVVVGKLPQGLAVTPDNAFVYVAVGSTRTVAVIDTATGAVSATVTGLNGVLSPTQVAITPDGKFAYVVEPGGDFPVIDRIDTVKNTVVDSVAGINHPSAIVIAPSGTLAYVADLCVGDGACVDVVDTTRTPPAVTSSIPIPNFTGTGSIAITPDGSVVCVSAVDPNLKVGVACINTTNGSEAELDLGQTLGLTNYGLAITPKSILYAAEPGVATALQRSVASINPNTTPPTLLNTIQVGFGPTSVAVGPAGAFVYVTNASDNTVSIINTATNAVATLGSGNGFNNPQGVAAMSASPPIIATQPASQVISAGQTAALSVVVTSAAPLSYQWYQGLAGDTSSPIEGAVGSSFTTSALTSTTSYWVQVTSAAGTVNSNTATVTVTSNQAPTCTLSVEGSGPPSPIPSTVTATADCTDPQGELLTTTIDFGDGALSSGANNRVFTASHNYDTSERTTFFITVTATDTSGLQAPPTSTSWTPVPTALTPPVFAGQSSDVTVMLSSPSGQPERVQFECTTVTTNTGTSLTVTQASALGISCSSNPPAVTLTAASQPVTIVIHTTGGASASMVPGVMRGTCLYASWLPLPVLVLLGIGFNSIPSYRFRFSYCLAPAALLVLALLSVSCGGGFTAPKVIQATPAGNYQITVIDLPLGSSTGFVQTSLIVPLTVNPFQ